MAAPIYDVFPTLLDTSAALTILEVGAHDGADSARLRALFPAARIYSFEPDPRNIAAIQRRGIDKQVKLVQAAVSDSDGQAQFHLSKANLAVAHPEWVKSEHWSASSSLKRPKEHLVCHPWCEFAETATVQTIRLDTFVRNLKLDHIDLLWADVQGAEDLLLAGGQQALRRTRFFYTEYSNTQEYEGQITLDAIMARLPQAAGGGPQWELLHRFPHDALFRNHRAS